MSENYSYYQVVYHAILTDGTDIDTSLSALKVRIVIESIIEVPEPKILRYAIDLSQKSKT